ncbi:MAG: helix-turn-helix domain-containing protein [Bacteroidales bacterium]|nr:helix-turn-helix domain-containing protein [Candidatus Cryptobacteroides caccocaballi]
MTRAILFILLAVVALYWAGKMVFFPKRKTIKSQKMMIFTLVILAAHMTSLALYSVPGLEGSIWVDVFHTIVAPLCPIFYILFIKFLTTREGVQKKDFALFLPVVIAWAVVIGINASMGVENWRAFVVSVVNNNPFASASTETFHLQRIVCYWCFKVFLAVEFAFALFYGNYNLKTYHTDLENYYSELIGFADSMDRYVAIYTWIAMFVSIALALSSNTIDSSSNPLVIVLLAVTGVIIYFVGQYSYGIETSTEDLVEKLEKANKAEEERKEETPAPGTIKNSMAKYSAALKAALDEQVYLEPGLELVDLAERLGTNRTYLSNIIHDEYGQNFAEFINSRRIKYAIELMQNSEEQYPMRYVAVKCGYSSLQTFYSNFARYTGGKTPASFLKK